jgi:hypothetical protein
LDIYWARNFKDWSQEVLKQPGILEAFEFEEMDDDKNNLKSEP